MSTNSQTTPLQNFQKVLFIILLLFSIHFWDLKFFPKKFNIENMIVWFACIGSFFVVLKKRDMRFRSPILLFILGLVLNAYAAYVNLDQAFRHSVLMFGYYYFILLYFLLHFFELDRKFLENTIITFGVIYSMLFSMELVLYPYDLFNRDVSTAVEEVQLEILGHGFLMLSYFLVLNRYFLTRKFLNLVMAFIFLLVLLKSGFRSLFFGAVITTLIMVLRMVRLKGRDFAMIFVFAGLVFGLMQFKGISGVLDQMITKTNKDIKLGNKYVRNIEMEFFFKKYPRNWTYFVIGGGKVTGKNIFVYNPEIFGMNYNIVWVDIGLLGFFIVIGAVATLGILWYSIKAIFTKIPEDSYYLRFYFLYLLIVSFTNEEIYRNGIFSVQALALYLIDLAAREQAVSVTKTDESKVPQLTR